MYLDGIEQHQFCFFDPAPSPPPEDPYAVPPPPPPIPFGCPPPPPAPEPMPAQCTNFLECGQAYCPPPPAPGTPGGLDTLAPPPPPVDAQDSRLNIAYPNPEELYVSFNKFQLAGESHLGSSLPHSAGVADARGGVVLIRPNGEQKFIGPNADQRFGKGSTKTTESFESKYTTGTLPNGLAFAENGNILISNFGTDLLEVITREG